MGSIDRVVLFDDDDDDDDDEGDKVEVDRVEEVETDLLCKSLRDDDDDDDDGGGSVIATTCASFCAGTNFISSKNTGDLVALVILHCTKNLDPPSVTVDAIFNGCNTLKR